MKRQETLEIIKRVNVHYQNFKMDDTKLTLDIWQSVLENADYDKISLALLEYVKEGNEFAPTAGQLLKMANAMLEAERFVKRDPAEAFRTGYKCKHCKDTGIVIVRRNNGEEVAQICGECNSSTAETLRKGGYRNGKEWIPCAKQNVVVSYSDNAFKKASGETPFD